jgi:hypothetical protein
MDDAPASKQNKKIIQWVVLALLLISLAGNYVLFQQNKKLATNPQAAVQEQIQMIVDKVGKLMVLPSDETPTIVTVANTTELKSQPFFASTKPGDQVIMYPNNRRVIIYRPSENRIIEVGFINIGQQ